MFDSDLQCKGLCPTITLRQWKQGNDEWTQQNIYTSQLRVDKRGQVPSIVSEDTEIYMIIANIQRIEKCTQCRQTFIKTFCTPSILWTHAIRNSNGYFGCESTSEPDAVAGLNTWAYFEIKYLEPNLDYDWSKINIFTRQTPSTNQTAIILFDPTPRLNTTPTPLKSHHLKDPFSPYTHILEEVIKLQDSAVWAIRDHVRNIEQQDKNKPKGRPMPDYRRLHDIARHAIHVTESLDVAVQTIEHILKHHLVRCANRHSNSLLHYQHHHQYNANANSANASTDSESESALFESHTPFMDIHASLEFSQSCLTSLRHRSLANEKRLQNEIQLAFNTVAQHDASLSVKISHAMMSDSTALKTLAFVTFAFLPPTFISSIFSMSFFKFDDGVFAVSEEIWIYWAVAVPVTIVTTLLWSFWHKISPKERRQRPLKKAATYELRDLGLV